MLSTNFEHFLSGDSNIDLPSYGGLILFTRPNHSGLFDMSQDEKLLVAAEMEDEMANYGRNNEVTNDELIANKEMFEKSTQRERIKRAPI